MNPRKLFITLVIMCFTISTLGAKVNSSEEAILEMADGTTLKAWFHTAMIDEVKYIEVSETPNGKRVRYENGQINRITILPPNKNYIETVYVKADIYKKVNGKNLKKAYWVREDYKGNRITLYSALNESARPGMVGNASAINSVNERKFYISIDGGIAQWVSEDAPNIVNQKSANRSMLVWFFKKEYPDFAERIKNKEFDTKNSPVEIVMAWEKTYGLTPFLSFERHSCN